MNIGDKVTIDWDRVSRVFGYELEHGVLKYGDNDQLYFENYEKTVKIHKGSIVQIADIASRIVWLRYDKQYFNVSVQELDVMVSNKVRERDVERVPIWRKQNLTLKEAAEYSNIGINRLEMLMRNPKCPFALQIGRKRLIKRCAFDEYIKTTDII